MFKWHKVLLSLALIFMITSCTGPLRANSLKPGGFSIFSGSCFQRGSMTLLVIGLNHPDTELKTGRGADAVRLVKIDFDQKTVVMLPLPPDLYLTVPVPVAPETGQAILTEAVARLMRLADGDQTEKVRTAAAVVISIIDYNYKLKPDHYLVLDENGFVKVVDTLGGITIDVPNDLNNITGQLGGIKAGWQKFTGQQALDYSRTSDSIDVGTDKPRTSRQDQVLQALAAQAARPSTLLMLPALYQAYRDFVVTDLGWGQMASIGCERVIAQNQITSVQVDSLQFQVGADGRLVPSGDYLTNLIKNTFGN
jgi:LCP family protein required for cell wall assembly